MRKIIILLLLMLASPPAFADSTWAITRNGNAVAGAVFTDAEAARLVQWAIAQRKGTIVQTPANGSTPAVMRDPTTAEIVQLIASDFFTDLLTRATAWHKSQGAQSGADAVAPVVTK